VLVGFDFILLLFPNDWMNKAKQIALAREMLEFSRAIPPSMGFGWVLEMDYLTHFEAERLMTMRELIASQGFSPDRAFDVLDIGYLHGIVPEFLHREFPLAKFIVIDHPDSPVFRNGDYQKLISSRQYLQLVSCNIGEAQRLNRKFNLIIMGELIEHLDPTFAIESIVKLTALLHEGGRLVITTPNANGIANLYAQLRGGDAAHPVIPDATMNWPHIHLWSPTLLQRTLGHHGLKMECLRFNNGFEAQRFAQMNRKPSGFLRQIPHRALWNLSRAVPRLRGYFVAVFSKEAGGLL